MNIILSGNNNITFSSGFTFVKMFPGRHLQGKEGDIQWCKSKALFVLYRHETLSDSEGGTDSERTKHRKNI
jgi:hypothetical protein